MLLRLATIRLIEDTYVRCESAPGTTSAELYPRINQLYTMIGNLARRNVQFWLNTPEVLLLKDTVSFPYMNPQIWVVVELFTGNTLGVTMAGRFPGFCM
jgi:hypothetical protein